MISLDIQSQDWPIAGKFSIARGSKTKAQVLYLTLKDGAHVGRGEAVPYARYNETMEQSIAELEAIRPQIEAGITREQLQTLMPAGAARNALDCALWDLQAKTTGIRVWQRIGLSQLSPLKTAFTISLDSPEAMGEQAAHNAKRPILKLKIGSQDGLDSDLSRIEAVRKNAPKTRLIVDANEGLSFAQLSTIAADLKRLGVVLIEQPLKAGEDDALLGYDCPVPLCADESLHTIEQLAHCARLYSHINIKLDKTGGLTHALALKQAALDLGLGVMVGCMVATSLSMAPAMLIAQGVDFVDLDGSLLLSQDREDGLNVIGSILEPATPRLWG